MSCTLYWIPVNTEKNYLSSGRLRDILINKFGYHGILNHSHIQYLEGLSDGEFEEARELIDAINKYDSIEIGQEC